MNFSKEDLKTRSFRVYEEKRFDYEKKIEIKNGFAYTQGATLKFDYDINVVAEFMDRVSKLENPPKYTIAFNVKMNSKVKKKQLQKHIIRQKKKQKLLQNQQEKH